MLLKGGAKDSLRKLSLSRWFYKSMATYSGLFFLLPSSDSHLVEYFCALKWCLGRFNGNERVLYNPSDDLGRKRSYGGIFPMTLYLLCEKRIK